VNEANIRKVVDMLDLGECLKGHSGWLTAHCPFALENHSGGKDRNPSFGIRINDNGRSGYYCFSCGAAGSLTKLVRLVYLRDGEPRKALSMAALAESYETEIDFLEYEEGLSEVSEEQLDPVMYSAMYPLATEVEAARRYMQRRGVTIEAALLADLRYDPDYSRIMFPVMDQMKTLFGYVGRSVYDNAKPRVFTYPPLKKTKHLLGGHLVRDKFPKVVVEGQFAYATLLAKGARDFCDVVAIMGQDMSQEQAALLLGFGNPVVLLLDGDEAGERGTHKALQTLGSEIPITAPGYPDYAKGDPDNLAAADLYDMIYT